MTMELSPEAKVIRGLERILRSVKAQYDLVVSRYPPKDLRIAALGTPGNVVNSHYLFMSMVNGTVTELSWWKRSFQKDHLSELDMAGLKDLHVFERHGFFIFMFSRIEWTVRKLVTYLSPGVCDFGTAEFSSCYAHLLARLGLQSEQPLLDLCRLVRNSIHNNGHYVGRVYRHRSGPTDPNLNQEITWKGRLFAFRQYAQIDFLTSDFLLELYGDLFAFLGKVLAHPDVATPAFIEDRAYFPP